MFIFKDTMAAAGRFSLLLDNHDQPYIIDAVSKMDMLYSLDWWNMLVENNIIRKYTKLLEYNYSWQNTQETGLLYRVYGKGRLRDGTEEDFDKTLKMPYYDWIIDRRAEGDAPIKESYEKYKANGGYFSGEVGEPYLAFTDGGFRPSTSRGKF